MGISRVEIAEELVNVALETGNRTRSTKVLKGLPKGSRLLRAWVDQRPHRVLVLQFEHDSFPNDYGIDVIPMLTSREED